MTLSLWDKIMLQFCPLSQDLFKNSDLLSVFGQKKNGNLGQVKDPDRSIILNFSKTSDRISDKKFCLCWCHGRGFKKKYSHWDNETIRDTQSSSKSLWIGASHQFHLESFGRNGIHMTEATGFTPEPQEEKVVYKDRWQNGPRLD